MVERFLLNSKMHEDTTPLSLRFSFFQSPSRAHVTPNHSLFGVLFAPWRAKLLHGGSNPKKQRGVFSIKGGVLVNICDFCGWRGTMEPPRRATARPCQLNAPLLLLSSITLIFYQRIISNISYLCKYDDNENIHIQWYDTITGTKLCHANGSTISSASNSYITVISCLRAHTRSCDSFSWNNCPTRNNTKKKVLPAYAMHKNHPRSNDFQYLGLHL